MKLMKPAAIAAFFCLVASSGWAQVLSVKLGDPVGDARGEVDVTEVELTFSPLSGAYVILVRTTPEQPFDHRYVRLHLSFLNPDAPESSALFHDLFNDHPVDHECLGPSFPLHVRAGSREYPLFGKSAVLKTWKAGDRVTTEHTFRATNSSDPGRIVVDVASYSKGYSRSGVGSVYTKGFVMGASFPEDFITSVGILREIPTMVTLPLQYGRFGMGGFFHDSPLGSRFGPLAQAVSETGHIEINETFTTTLPNGVTETVNGSAITANDGATLAAHATVSVKDLRPPAALANACSVAVHLVQAQLAADSPIKGNLFLRILIKSTLRARSGGSVYVPTVPSPNVATVIVGTHPTDLKTFNYSASGTRRVTVALGSIDVRQPFNLILGAVTKASAHNANAESELTVVLEEVRLMTGSENSKPLPVLGFVSNTGLDFKVQNGFGVPTIVPPR